MNLRQQIEQYLSENIIIQVATSAGNKPWCSNLHYAYDDQLNIYWMSLKTSRHSQEIATNPDVAATVAKPHTLSDMPRGLQMEGLAAIADNFEEAFKVYMERYPKWLFREDELRRGNAEDRAIYKLSPSRIIMFDIANDPKNPHQELVI